MRRRERNGCDVRRGIDGFISSLPRIKNSSANRLSGERETHHHLPPPSYFMRGFPERNPRTTDEDFTPSGLVGRLRRIVVRGNTPHEQPGEIVPVTKLGHKGPFAPSLLFPAKVTPHKQPKINARKISLADWARRRPLDVVASFPALPESTDADFCADKKSRGCSSLPLFSPRNGDRNRTTAMARIGAALRPSIRLGKSAGR